MDAVVEVIAHLTTADPGAQQVNLETAMQALVLDPRQPVALEIAGEPTAKRFLMRALRPEALAHAEAQVRMRYPQASFDPVSAADDPLVCRAGEGVSVVELQAGAASYLPLQTWEEQALRQPGTDPVLGILAAMTLPPEMRAVTQIALVPASPNWSKHQQRRALEPALDAEKKHLQEQMQEARQGAPSTLGVLLLIVLCGILVLVPHLTIPLWIGQTIRQVFLGQWPTLSRAHWIQVGVVCVCLIGLPMPGRLLKRPRLYDQKLAAQKTLTMAYRVRIRLYVFGPAEPAIRPLWRTSWQALRQRTLIQEWRILWHEHQNARRVRALRETVLASLSAAYRQYDLARGSFFRPKHLRSERVALLFGRDWLTRLAQKLLTHPAMTKRSMRLLFCWLPDWVARRTWTVGVRHSPHLLAPESLKMLWHLLEGQALQEATLVPSRRARTLLLPRTLMTPPTDHDHAIGVSRHGGLAFPFVPPESFIRYHTLLGGQSGEGKSTLMQSMALQAIENGSACCVIDPHGDLVEAILAHISPRRVADTVLIDFGTDDRSIGLNPLDVTLGRARDKAIEDLLVTLRFIYKESWGNRMESPFRHALLTLFAANEMLVARDPLQGPDQQYTLLDVLPILTDESFCHTLLDEITDDYLKRWWYLYYEPLSLQQQRERVDPVFTKISKLEMQAARRIVGQGRSTLNFGQLLRERKIILVSLAKGKAGSDSAPLLGSTLMGLLLAALQEQIVLAPTDRVSLPIFVDEFQSLGGVDYQTMLAELRKWGGACCLATQSFAYLHEMTPALLPTVLANVKQKIIFRMSAKDASIIAPEIGVEPEDIVHLDPHTCYLSIPAAGRQQPTFSLVLSPPPVGDPQVAAQIRLQSQPYTRPGSEIDTALQTAITRTIQAKSQKEEKKHDVPTTGRVRTRKGKEDSSAAATKGHGSLQSLELLAASPQMPAPQEELSPSHADEAEELQES